MTNKPPAKIMGVPTLDALRDTLRDHNINLARWGTGTAKSVENLWEELNRGETRLHAAPLVRVITGVVQVIVQDDDGRTLVEAEQIFNDGRRRQRGMPPAEKMLPGEKVCDAALRCLNEELDLSAEQVTLLPETYTCKTEQRPSWSYPGLDSYYTIHQVAAQVSGLPEDSFSTSETVEGGESVVSEHRWEWA